MKPFFACFLVFSFCYVSVFGQFQSSGNDLYHTGGDVFIGASSSFNDARLSLGTWVDDHVLAIYENGTSFYGIGISAGTLRFEVPGNSTNRYSFFSGSGEILRLNNNGSSTFKGDDPDLALSINSGSSASKAELRFQVSGTSKASVFYNKSSDKMIFWHDGTEVMKLDKNGGNYFMEVEHGIRTGRVKTDASLADYVFEPDYDIPSLSEVEQYVETHHHLPGVISQTEVDAQGGVELTAFTVQLQEKIEELYLHVIALEKQVKELQQIEIKKSSSSLSTQNE